MFFFTDGALLIQPLANQAQSASARSKPDLVGKVAGKARVESHLNKSKSLFEFDLDIWFH